MSRRSEILEAAGRLFSESGYQATSMRDLAKAVNLQGGSLYAHVQSKEEVLCEIVNRAADRFLAAAEAIPPDLPPTERLRRLIHGHLRVVADEIGYATVFFHEWRFLSPELRDRIKARRDAYEAYFSRAIDEGMERGEFDVADRRIATLFVLSALNWTYQWFDPAGRLGVDALAEQYTTLIVKALGGTA